MMTAIQDQYNAYQEEVRRKELAQQEAAERQQRLQGLSTLLSMFGNMNQDEGTSPFSYMAGMLSMMPNTSSRGGRLQRKNLYDGKTEPTGYLRRMKDANSGEVGDVVGLNDDGTYNVSYSNGIQPMALQAPELKVLGNYNPRRMSPEEKEALMRVQRGLDERPIGGELKNNQNRTMPTNSEANTFADAWASQTAPTVGHLIAAGLKPLDLVTPSRYVGLLDSDNKNGFLHLFDEDNRGLFINDNPQGMFSKRYAEEHPYWAMAGNLVGDVAAGYGIGKSFPVLKNFYHSAVREPIPFIEKQAAAQRMEDFIRSADYIRKQKLAGLSDTEIGDFQNMVQRRLNGGDFPAYYSRIKDDGMSLILPKPIGGIYMNKNLSLEDFLRAFDHEVGHYSTVNFGKTGYGLNGLFGLVNKEKPAIVEKMLDYNTGIVPPRPMTDALKVRRDRGFKSGALWLNKPKTQSFLNYVRDEQEARSNAYAILQDAERRGMSIDEYVDFCTSPGGEIYNSAPKPIRYLNYAYTPENMKKFLKGFLSISAPTTLLTNTSNKDAQ